MSMVAKGKALIVTHKADGTSTQLCSRVYDASFNFLFTEDRTEYLGTIGTKVLQDCDGCECSFNIHLDDVGMKAYTTLIEQTLIKARSVDEDGTVFGIDGAFTIPGGGGSVKRIVMNNCTVGATTISGSGQKAKQMGALKFTCGLDDVSILDA